MAVATTISHNDVRTDRHLYIGGSDIGAIMGVSPFKTPFELWCEKTQKIPMADLSKKDNVRMGEVLEEFVAQEFTHRTGLQVRRAPKVYIHKDYDFLRAHVDRLITSSDEGLECKNTSEFNSGAWKDADIPESYILQCQWCMGLSNRKAWYIAVLIGGNKYQYKKIEFDTELFGLLIEKACEFWDMVQNDTPPEITADDDKTLSTLYSEHSDNIIEMYDDGTERTKEALTDFETAVAKLQETKAHISDLESEKKTIETNIKNLIQDNMGIKTPKYKIIWKEQAKTNVNTQALKDDGVYEQYTTKTSYRVLRITTNKDCEVA